MEEQKFVFTTLTEQATIQPTARIEGTIQSLINLCRDAQKYHPNFIIQHSSNGGVELRFYGDWVWPDAAEAIVEKRQDEEDNSILGQLYKKITGWSK